MVNTSRKEALVLGAGMIGLSTAIRLMEAGFSVTIMAKDFSPNTTSDKAGAIWLPYNINPPEKATVWSKCSFEVFENQALAKDSGVSMVIFRVALRAEELGENGQPWWTAGFPNESYFKRVEGAPTAQYACTFDLHVPFIDPTPYLAYLTNILLEKGAVFQQETVTDFDDCCQKHANKLLFNCTGLGAKILLNDAEMFAIQGQMLALSPSKRLRYLKADHSPTKPTYIFPRKNAVMLGGSAVRNEESEFVDEVLSADIYQRCLALDPQLANNDFLYAYVGLRPGRTSIRLERMGNVIHNYGHGGGGYTAAWGCAEEAVRLALLM